MNETQLELLQLKAQNYDAIAQIEICKIVINQNVARIEELEKILRDENLNGKVQEQLDVLDATQENVE